MSISGSDFLKITICIVIGFLSEAKAAPSPEQWFSEVQNSVKILKGVVPAKIILLKSYPKMNAFPKFLDVDSDEFNKNGFIQLVSPTEASAIFLINQRPDNLLTAKELAEKEKMAQRKGSKFWMPQLFDSSDVDTIVYARGKKSWNAYQITKGKPNIASKLTPLTNKTAKANEYYDWLMNELSYDAYVIDVKDNRYFLLALLRTPNVRETLQALAIKDSANKLSLKGQKKDGLGVMQSISLSTNSSVGVFEVLISDKNQSAILPGTKVILEEKK